MHLVNCTLQPSAQGRKWQHFILYSWAPWAETYEGLQREARRYIYMYFFSKFSIKYLFFFWLAGHKL